MSCFGMCLGVGDKVSFGKRVCRITKNHDSGLFRIEEIDGNFQYEAYADEIDFLISRRCVELGCKNDVSPIAKRGRCEECLSKHECFYSPETLKCFTCGKPKKFITIYTPKNNGKSEMVES